MKKKAQLLMTFLIILFGLSESAPTSVSGNEKTAEDSPILYRYTDAVLKDSKWGRLTDFQDALFERLRDCGQMEAVADGQFGPRTQQSIIDLFFCPGFTELAVWIGDQRRGAIDTALWTRLLPNTQLPTVHQRAFVLSLSHEGTDYDQAEWNYGTRDDASALTWGPYGATVGGGQEVQGILKKIESDDSHLLPGVFATEFATVKMLIDNPDRGHAILKDVWKDAQRRALWQQKFAQLGTLKVVRDAYEWYAWRSSHWLQPPLRRLYRLIPDATENATEIDYAYFLDLAIHMKITEQRIRVCQQAIARRERLSGRSLNQPERRRVISLSLEPTKRKLDRLGRNVVYYIDGIGEKKISPRERNAWLVRTRLRASNCGLSDIRKFPPALN